MNNLCLTCSFSQIIRGHSISQERIICTTNNWHPVELRFPVQQCDRYTDGRARVPEEMKQIAWTVRVKQNRFVGFTPPQKDED
jgi:hypothetical protein